IAVVHPSLWSAIDPLLDYRAAQGLRVAKVDVQDIYDEWSYGRRDPEAIRSFLTYAYRCWNGGLCAAPPAVPPNPPQYVLLVGDGHYDFTGVSGTTFPNLIPPYLVHVDPWLGEALADNRYVSVDGPDDFMPDMAIGRIPANTPAEVEAVVAKTIAYETTSPVGPWQERVVFVADRDVDPAGNFHALSDYIRLQWLPASYDDRTIYYLRDYFTGPEMRAAVRSAFNDDAFLIQWFGHSSRYQWGSFVAFNVYDPPTLGANDSWPITTQYTCYSGYFANLTWGLHSLGEILAREPLRGSVADFSSAGANLGDSLLVLNTGMTRAIFQDRIDPLGKSVDAAKLYYFQNSGGFYNVIDTYILFGDPALKLRLPQIALAVDLAAFEAVAQDGAVQVTWETVSEQDTVGFTLYRSQSSDQVGQPLAFLPAQSPGSSQGAVYSYTDTAVVPGQSYWYRLEDLDTGGVTTQHGPVGVTVEQPTAVRVGQIEAGRAPAAGLWQRLLAALGR
ncbi:MAG TPA: C25 family cysteine peptidase, partial [Anaerolineae bacterium]|nr:C25 family cysteine peptidase [Anaerolineae bacterium]